MGLLILCYRYDYCGVKKGRMFWYVVMLIVMICVIGLRYRIGTDSIRYERYYMAMHTLGNLGESDFSKTRFAPLYIILASACRTVTKDFTLLQFVVAIIVNGTVFWFFRQNTKHIFLAVMLYYVFLYLNLNTEVIREALAVSLFLLSWPFFKRGQWLIYYCFVTVAFFFHISALVLAILPLLWLPGVRYFFSFGRRTWLICLILALGSFALQYFFFDFIKVIAFTENMMERAEVYSKHDLASSNLNIIGIMAQLIRTAAYPAAAIFFINREHGKKAVDKDKGLLKEEMMTLMAVYFGLLTLGVDLFARYNNYFMFFSFVTVSNWAFTPQGIRGRRKIKLSYFYWCMIFVPLIGLQIQGLYLADFNKSGTIKRYMAYYPYSHRFDPKEYPDRENLFRYNRRY